MLLLPILNWLLELKPSVDNEKFIKQGCHLLVYPEAFRSHVFAQMKDTWLSF
jgi:hypothetical protein